MNIDKYHNIVEELVRKSFPSLKNVQINLQLRKLRNGSMRASRGIFNYKIIIDSEKYKDANLKQIKGAIAHELMHFEDYKSKNYISYLFYLIHYLFSKKFMIKKEIEIDKKTIERGYGNELVENRRYRLRGVNTKNIKFRPYMLPEEIKSYAKSIGKW